MEAGFREDGKPSIQANYDPTKSYGDIDIDFRHGFWGKAKVVGTIGLAKVGALSVDNSNIGKNKESYEKKYGQIPRKQ